MRLVKPVVPALLVPSLHPPLSTDEDVAKQCRVLEAKVKMLQLSCPHCKLCAGFLTFPGDMFPSHALRTCFWG